MIGNQEAIAIKFIITSSCIFIHDINIHRYVLDSWFKGRLCHCSVLHLVLFFYLTYIFPQRLIFSFTFFQRDATKRPSMIHHFHQILSDFTVICLIFCKKLHTDFDVCKPGSTFNSDVSFFLFHCITTIMLCYISLLIINKVKCVTFKTA